MALMRKIALKAGPQVLPIIPGKQRRKGLSVEMRKRRSKVRPKQKDDHAAIAEKAAKSVLGSLTLSQTLIAARSARLAGRDALNRSLLEACYDRIRTSPALLAELVVDRLKSGRQTEAEILIQQAIALDPSRKSVARAYLAVHMKASDGAPLKAALLKRFKSDMVMVWAFCKACKTQDDLDQIFMALAPNGILPIKYVRAYGNAALRAERFDLGREQYLRAIEAAVEKLPSKITPPKTIGTAGTQALVDIVKLLNSASVPHFAAAGTCLGMVREGRPLPHDNDIDIGIMESDFNQAALIELAQSSPLFTVSPPHPRNPKVGLKHISGAELDLFKFYKEAGKIWHNGVFIRWGNTPFTLETRSLNGVGISIPAGTNYLVENYGEDWYKPDPLFDAFMNGPNREVVWDDYYGAQILRAINLSLRRGTLTKAVSFMRDEINGSYLTRLEKDTLRIALDLTETKIKAGGRSNA